MLRTPSQQRRRAAPPAPGAAPLVAPSSAPPSAAPEATSSSAPASSAPTVSANTPNATTTQGGESATPAQAFPTAQNCATAQNSWTAQSSPAVHSPPAVSKNLSVPRSVKAKRVLSDEASSKSDNSSPFLTAASTAPTASAAPTTTRSRRGSASSGASASPRRTARATGKPPSYNEAELIAAAFGDRRKHAGKEDSKQVQNTLNESNSQIDNESQFVSVRSQGASAAAQDTGSGYPGSLPGLNSQVRQNKFSSLSMEEINADSFPISEDEGEEQLPSSQHPGPGPQHPGPGPGRPEAGPQHPGSGPRGPEGGEEEDQHVQAQARNLSFLFCKRSWPAGQDVQGDASLSDVSVRERVEEWQRQERTRPRLSATESVGDRNRTVLQTPDPSGQGQASEGHGAVQQEQDQVAQHSTDRVNLPHFNMQANIHCESTNVENASEINRMRHSANPVGYSASLNRVDQPAASGFVQTRQSLQQLPSQNVQRRQISGRAVVVPRQRADVPQRDGPHGPRSAPDVRVWSPSSDDRSPRAFVDHGWDSTSESSARRAWSVSSRSSDRSNPQRVRGRIGPGYHLGDRGFVLTPSADEDDFHAVAVQPRRVGMVARVLSLQARIDKLMRYSWPRDVHNSSAWMNNSPEWHQNSAIFGEVIYLFIEHIIVVHAWGELNVRSSPVADLLRMPERTLLYLEICRKSAQSNCLQFERDERRRLSSREGNDLVISCQKALLKVLLMLSKLHAETIQHFKEKYFNIPDNVSEAGNSTTSFVSLTQSLADNDVLSGRMQEVANQINEYVQDQVRIVVKHELNVGLSRDETNSLHTYPVEVQNFVAKMHNEVHEILLERIELTKVQQSQVNPSVASERVDEDMRRRLGNLHHISESNLAPGEALAHGHPQVQGRGARPVGEPDQRDAEHHRLRSRIEEVINQRTGSTPPQLAAQVDHPPIAGQFARARAQNACASTGAIPRNYLSVPLSRGPSHSSTPTHSTVPGLEPIEIPSSTSNRRSLPPPYVEAVRSAPSFNPEDAFAPREAGVRFSSIPRMQQDGLYQDSLYGNDNSGVDGSENAFPPHVDEGDRQNRHNRRERRHRRHRSHSSGQESRRRSHSDRGRRRRGRRSHSSDRDRRQGRNPDGGPPSDHSSGSNSSRSSRSSHRRGRRGAGGGSPSSPSSSSSSSGSSSSSTHSSDTLTSAGRHNSRERRRQRRRDAEEEQQELRELQEAVRREREALRERRERDALRERHRRDVLRERRDSPADADIRRPLFEQTVRAPAQTMNDSAFPSANERDLFQLSLPKPWNVRITSTAKQSEELATIRTAFNKKESKFKVGGDYFQWRAEANQYINQANIPIATKIIALKDACTIEKNDLLDIIFRLPQKDKKTYRQILVKFEQYFGGREKATRYVTDQLYGHPKLNVTDYNSCISTLSVLERFIQHSQMHGEEDSLNQRVQVQKVFEKLLLPSHVKAIKKDKQLKLLRKSENSVLIIVEWLKKIISQWDYVKNKLPASSLKSATAKPSSSTAPRTSTSRRFVPRTRPTTLAADAVSADEEEEDAAASIYEVDESYHFEDDAESTEPESSCEDGAVAAPSPGVEPSAEENAEVDCDHLEGLAYADANMYSFFTKQIMADKRQLIDCGYCKKARKQTIKHPIWKCPYFQKLSVKGRRDWIIGDKRCTNCLTNAHTYKECTSIYTCRICKSKHATLLHDSTSNKK